MRNKIKKMNCTDNMILEVDLTPKKTYYFTVEENEKVRYLGGKGLGLKYLSERMLPGTDPLGKDGKLPCFHDRCDVGDWCSLQCKISCHNKITFNRYYGFFILWRAFWYGL